MNYKMKKAILLIAFLTIMSCKKNNSTSSNNNNEIATEKTKKWMSYNLDTYCFRNGDSIPEATSLEEWNQFSDEHKPAWCYYNNDVENKYLGKLYNWYAINDKRGLAPKGWHIASKNEWLDYALNKKKENKIYDMKLLGGCRNPDGEFIHLGDFGYWWTSTEQNVDESWIHFLREDGWEGEDYGYKSGGKYVLCASN